MPSPRDETSGRAGSSGGTLREPVGRIPPQTTVPGAAETMPLPSADGRPAAQVAGGWSAPSVPASAGVVTRLLAAGVDAVAVVLAAVLLDLGVAGVRFVWSPMDFTWPRPEISSTVIALCVIAVGYLAIGWALAGRTYGSRLLGLRVLSSRYELLGWTRAVLRALVCVLFPVGLLWCGISRRRSSLADVLLRTVVVYDARPYARPRHGS